MVATKCFASYANSSVSIALIPRVVYYSRVGLELGKLVAQQRAMAPPYGLPRRPSRRDAYAYMAYRNAATIQSYTQPLINGLRNPMSLFARTAESSAAQPVNILNRVRGLSQTQWISAGVVAAEVIGFFTVGEMLGRFKLVGYRSSAPAHH